MKTAAQTLARLLVAVAMLACCGCPGTLPDGTTNIGVPAPCNADEDCPEGIGCIFPDGESLTGFCDIEETLVQ